MDLDALLGIDPNDPEQALADRLVQADDALLDALIAERKRRKLTQSDVGTAMGVTQSAVARIEAGERDPHLSTLRRYALAVGAEVRHIVKPFDPKAVHRQRINGMLAASPRVPFTADRTPFNFRQLVERGRPPR